MTINTTLYRASVSISKIHRIIDLHWLPRLLLLVFGQVNVRDKHKHLIRGTPTAMYFLISIFSKSYFLKISFMNNHKIVGRRPLRINTMYLFAQVCAWQTSRSLCLLYLVCNFLGPLASLVYLEQTQSTFLGLTTKKVNL